MIYKSQTRSKKETGLSYLGSVSMTTKHKKSIKYGELTYSLYLSPGRSSGYEVCPGRTKECTLLCLNESGMNTMAQNQKGDVINNSRIKKTKLFFENKEYFMNWLVDEIISAKLKSKKLNYKFSIRLNNTSDINPEEFVLDGKNILEIFKDDQFYDYTKVKERYYLLKYPNYHLTFSFNGYNEDVCKEMLLNGINVAVVFKNILPETFWGYPVINGDDNDLRHKDHKGVIIGLKFKRVRNMLNPNSKFVIS